MTDKPSDTAQKRSGTFFVKGEKIVLKKDGTWVADGVEITHEQTCDLFYRSIHWDEKEKKYCLRIGYETLFIEVEDTPFFVTALREEAGASIAMLSSHQEVSIKPNQLKYEDARLYLLLENGLRAKFLSAAYYELLKKLKEDEKYYYLLIDGAKVNLAEKYDA